MLKILRRVLPAAALAHTLAGASLAHAQPADAPPPGRSPELWGVLDDYVAWQMDQSPEWATQRGLPGYADRLSDPSPEATRSRLADMQSFLNSLARLSELPLSPADHEDIELLARDLQLGLEGARFHPEQTPVDARWGPQIWLPQMPDQLNFNKPGDYADFAARLEQIPWYLEQTTRQMRLGLEAGRVPPRASILGADQQAAALATEAIAADPTQSPFYRPFAALDDDHPTAARARAAIEEGVTPAFAEFARFLREEYIPACRESPAASDSVDGLAWYAHQLKVHTTTDLTPDEVHQIGLREVARIRAEMIGVVKMTDWYADRLEATVDAPEDDDALLASFIDYLRTHPRFYHDSPEALLAGYRDIAKRVDAELPRFFRVMPRLPYGVREMPALAAPGSPTAYYYPGSLRAGVPGYFVANTYRLDQRPRYEMIALTLHEAVPGHHLQIAIKQELEGVHEFRTLQSVTAFSEGWALYAERLGLEMGDRPLSQGGFGFYDDPYDNFGRLTYEMWRACRLVVDPGIHAKGWSRQQAIDFMLANTALSAHNVEKEVDRYIGWPGQACGYKLGELKIRELRALAEGTLGDDFDLRAFHDHLLAAGAIPLDVLESRMFDWVEAQRSGN